MRGKQSQERFAVVVLIACAALLLFGLHPRADDFLVTPEVADDGQGLHIHFPSSTDVYFQVWASDSMTGAWTHVRGMTLGSDGTQRIGALGS